VRENVCMNNSKELPTLAVDTREAARLLSVSPRSIQNYIRAKMLPSRKIGKRRVIPVRALENFLRSDQPSPVSK
jgi:excisionase family DNA binding protein